jgi:hypothetical protein
MWFPSTAAASLYLEVDEQRQEGEIRCYTAVRRPNTRLIMNTTRATTSNK